MGGHRNRECWVVIGTGSAGWSLEQLGPGRLLTIFLNAPINGLLFLIVYYLLHYHLI